jgi:hypothetical protein
MARYWFKQILDVRILGSSCVVEAMNGKAEASPHAHSFWMAGAFTLTTNGCMSPRHVAGKYSRGRIYEIRHHRLGDVFESAV